MRKFWKSLTKSVYRRAYLWKIQCGKDDILLKLRFFKGYKQLRLRRVTVCSVHSSNFPNAYFLLSLSLLVKFLSFLLFLTQAPFFQERHAACRYIVVKVLLFSANGVGICWFLNGKNQSVISQISGHFSNLQYFNFQTCLTVPETTTN